MATAANKGDFVSSMEKKVLSGASIEFDEAVELIQLTGADRLQLFASAHRIREAYCGNEVHLCGIVNAKSGACSENCNFCSQSAAHDTNIPTYSLLDSDSILEASDTAAKNGASAFGIVTAWRGIKKGRGLDQICEAIQKIKNAGKIVPDLSLGLIEDPDVAQALADAGAVEYNHNLEAGPSFFPNICTTHKFEDRVKTIQYVKAAGMKVCSGGIFGLGETPAQRVELGFELKKLDVKTTPLNFYHHTEGNNVDLAKLKKISPLEALQIVSVFRFILPGNVLKIAGGRESTLGEFQSMMFLTGANSTMVGHYLTTSGRQPADDLALIEESGLVLSEHGCSVPEAEVVMAK